jgi:predicted DNA-binding transcriptional regulator YafY
MSNLHRIAWMDAQIREMRYPNSRTLAERFEISQRQASRDIEYMRYSMGAPLEYSALKGGYFYSDSAFKLPEYYITKEEKQALSYLTFKYLKMGGDQGVRIAELFSKITGEELADGYGQGGISVFSIDSTEAGVFDILKRAVRNRTSVEMIYSNAGGEVSRRSFDPYKLFVSRRLNYVVGFCGLKNDIRVFRLDRIKKVYETQLKFSVSPLFNENNFTDDMSFSFRDPFIARVRFSSAVSENDIKLPITAVDMLVYEIRFLASDEILQALLSLSAEFTILSPVWLKNRFREKLMKLLQKNS